MTTTMIIDLMPFCAKENGRYAITEPWVKGGHRYATDSRIIVRVSADGEADTEGNYPPAEDILCSFPADAIYAPWPAPNYLEANVTCPNCFGKGKAGVSQCSVCDGKGECPHCGGECGGCHGTSYTIYNYMSCKHCDGRGVRWQPHYLKIGTRFIAFKYAEIIRTIPGVEYCYGIHGDKHDKPLGFRFPGGVGAIMPVVSVGAIEMRPQVRQFPVAVEGAKK